MRNGNINRLAAATDKNMVLADGFALGIEGPLQPHHLLKQLGLLAPKGDPLIGGLVRAKPTG